MLCKDMGEISCSFYIENTNVKIARDNNSVNQIYQKTFKVNWTGNTKMFTEKQKFANQCFSVFQNNTEFKNDQVTSFKNKRFINSFPQWQESKK